MPSNMNKLNEIYAFLEENQEHNKKLQNATCEDIFGRNAGSPTDHLRAILFEAVHTQRNPILDKLKNFWIDFDQYSKTLNGGDLSLDDFLKTVLNPDFEGSNYLEALYSGLKAVDGWGCKTAAMATKNLFLISQNHCLEFPFDEKEKLKDKQHELNVPVDTVINFIFKELGLVDKGSGDAVFREINRQLKMVKGSSPIIWDDLWFWGFITQRNKKPGPGRDIVWNPGKLYGLKYAYLLDAEEIKSKAKEFIELL